jgi:hypothetical protein
MLNPFFLNGSSGEQNLIQSLINEQLMMYGVEVYYLPRQYVTSNTVIKEVIQSEFNNAYPIEAYLDNYEGYTGQGTILSKFGIENKDDLQLIISKERYENYITPLIKDIPNIELSTRPKEGDLIYFPLGDRLFEIKFVEHEQPFYQLKKTYVYELRCELFRYEDEIIDTSVSDIDNEVEDIGYIQTLNLIGTGTSATATATVCSSGGINKITISNMGKNYSSTPVVGFSSAPSGGVTAVGIASLSYNYPGCKGKSGVVASILLTNTGCGYTKAPMITVQGGGGSGFAATTGISTDGSIQSIEVTSGGSGYVNAPAVTITDSELPVPTQNAVAISTISSSGIVTGIYILEGGSGYGSSPVVTIENPVSAGTNNVSLGGTFIYNEVVTGSSSGTTARVKDWNGVTDVMEIGIISGTFVNGEYLTGSDSGAKYVIGGVNTDDLVTAFADNDNIETEGDSIIDFSSSNPFGMP